MAGTVDGAPAEDQGNSPSKPLPTITEEALMKLSPRSMVSTKQTYEGHEHAVRVVGACIYTCIHGTLVCL